MKTVFLCLIFGSIISCALSAEGDSNARLLISKHILNQFVVEGKELTVHYSIYNVGSGPATSVLLTDNSFPADQFNVLHGLLSVKWKAVAPGTNVSHTIILEPKRSGIFNFTSAQVSYQPFEDATDPQMAFSTMPGEGRIMPLLEFERKHSPHLVDWGLFSLMSLPTILIPFLVWFRSHSKYESHKPKRH
ncbi:translocon-associated protein subunit beta-like [Acropora muricata]|uniref:translocon-associated protein subunit beta-like n=1 Tax=Acropora millepora TaxID=45264 RepID=UPI0010FCD614|nr:translocon-associated protein subunit beta-like [Acropora millepora]XP_044179888.1 translocon-associated protein subunit beta-like [Acropora millepora]